MQADVGFIESQLTEHLAEQSEEILSSSRSGFLETGFSLISYLLPDSIKKPLAEEIRLLVETPLGPSGGPLQGDEQLRPAHA